MTGSLSPRNVHRPPVSVYRLLDLTVCTRTEYSLIIQSTYPSEVLDCIVGLSLAKRHTFKRIASFSMASYQFRHVALRRYFTLLKIRSPKHWAGSDRVMDFFRWVR